ncbi:MATE family efflux transporter [Thomasclavelia spiroformis]|jgi:putative MATE family efflux protein|uniref:MATE family efflux transporter n=1 Tax=Thomasclavelia spiroformis TaxID=29348 RepID=UPI00241C02CC|nr:MATE family efflux transporter [Thomasclavelia spiroformis]
MLFSNQDLKKLIIPLIIEQILVILVGFSDTVMVASVGEAAVSAVSLVDGINVLLINIFSALATGGAVVASQFIGQGSIKKAQYSAKQLILITALLASVLMIIIIIFNGSLLQLIFGHVEVNVMKNAEIYFLFSAISYPFIALYNAGAALFRAIGNSKISMINSAIMNVINIGLNAVFIFGFKWGVFGAVLATLIARMVACTVILKTLSHKNNELYVDDYLHWHFDFTYIKKILTIGIPSGLENGMFQFGKILVQSLIASFGTYSIAANAVSNNLAQMQIIPGMAMSLAMVTVVGRCVGANDYKQAKYYIKKLMKITYITMAVLIAVLLVFTPIILKFYVLSKETIDLAYQCIFIHTIFAATIWPLAFTFPNALRASNDAKFTMIVSATSMWIFRFCFSYIIGRYMGYGLLGVWIAMFIDWIVRSIFFIWRYHSGKWMNKQLV